MSVFNTGTSLNSSKDMNISVKETTVFSVFHPDAQDLYNTCSDLKKVAWELWDPSFRLNDEVGFRFKHFLQRADNGLFRIKTLSFFMPLHLCSVNVQRRKLKTRSKK